MTKSFTTTSIITEVDQDDEQNVIWSQLFVDMRYTAYGSSKNALWYQF